MSNIDLLLENDNEDIFEEELREDIQIELDQVLASDLENTVATQLPNTASISEINQSLMSEVLTGKSPEYRSNVLRVAYQAGVDKDDPLFAVLLATGQLELLLYQKPDELNNLFKIWQEKWTDDLNNANAILTQEREQIRLLIDDTQETLKLQSKAALDVQKRNITKTVTELVKKAAFEKVAHDANALICAGLILLGAVGLGVVLGLAIPVFAKPPELDPVGLRQLTLEEAKAMEWGLSAEGKFARNNRELITWAKSKEGNFARQLMQWNQDLLVGKSTKQCEIDAKNLGVTLELGGRLAKSGYCTLWIKPPHEREFVLGTN